MKKIIIAIIIAFIVVSCSRRSEFPGFLEFRDVCNKADVMVVCRVSWVAERRLGVFPLEVILKNNLPRVDLSSGRPIDVIEYDYEPKRLPSGFVYLYSGGVERLVVAIPLDGEKLVSMRAPDGSDIVLSAAKSMFVADGSSAVVMSIP